MIDDLELVRTFLAVLESGSFSAAAPGVFRSQAAVSQQIRRLEQQIGEALFIRTSRRMQLSAAGERFLPHARRLLRASAEARLAARGDGRRLVRLGVADDLAAAVVMPALARLRAQHGELAFEVTVGATRSLHVALATRLDVLVGLALPGRAEDVELARWELDWFGAWSGRGPLPLALCDEGCLLRERGVAALDRAGVAWEVLVAASGMAVVEAALATGLAVGVLAEPLAGPGMARVEGLPPLGQVGVCLYADDDMDAATLRWIDAALREQLVAAGTR